MQRLFHYLIWYIIQAIFEFNKIKVPKRIEKQGWNLEPGKTGFLL